MVGLLAFPIFMSLFYSFFSITFGQTITYTWQGLTNWVMIFSDPEIPAILRQTAYYMTATLSLAILGSLGVAVILNLKFHGRRVMSALLLVPWAIPSVAVAQMWMWMFNAKFGIVNTVLTSVGFTNFLYTNWLDPAHAMITLVLAQVWKEIPLPALIILAALQTVEKEQLESAMIDGANAIQRFISISLPSIRTTLAFVIVILTLESFKIFDMVYVLTHGYFGTMVLYFYVYDQGFAFGHPGYASALAWTLWAMIAVLSVAYARLLAPSFRR